MSKRIQTQSKGRNTFEESKEDQRLEQNTSHDAAPAMQTAVGAPATPPQPETQDVQQSLMQEFMAQIRQQQEDFMHQMAMRHEELALEIIRSREEMQRGNLIHHQRLTTERSTPIRENQITRNNEETPADLTINIDGSNIRNINRRDSAVHRLTTYNGAMSREGTLILESDKHASIIWENRSIDGFLKFLDEIDKFTLTYNQLIHPYQRKSTRNYR